MKTLTIQEVNALQAYKEADKNGKTLLTNLFGKAVFNQTITDRVKSFEDACIALGIDRDDAVVNVGDGLTPDEKAINAFAKLTLIAKALNEGWTPDWDKSSQYKYYPFFDMRSGFSFNGVGGSCARSTLGSRLCFKNEALAKYAGTQFLDLYRQMMVI